MSMQAVGNVWICLNPIQIVEYSYQDPFVDNI